VCRVSENKTKNITHKASVCKKKTEIAVASCLENYGTGKRHKFSDYNEAESEGTAFGAIPLSLTQDDSYCKIIFFYF
jgi:hypothetical protein